VRGAQTRLLVLETIAQRVHAAVAYGTELLMGAPLPVADPCAMDQDEHPLQSPSLVSAELPDIETTELAAPLDAAAPDATTASNATMAHNLDSDAALPAAIAPIPTSTTHAYITTSRPEPTASTVYVAL
jgi:hypothetical protein